MAAQLQEIEAVYLRQRHRWDNGPDKPPVVIGDIRLLKGEPTDSRNGSNGANNGANNNRNGFNNSTNNRNRTGNLSLAIKGPDQDGELLPQLAYRFWGKWQRYRNSRTGREELQFGFSTFLRAQPHGRAAIMAYLRLAGKGRGVGNTLASHIYDHFGGDALRILKENPEVVASSIRGLSLDSAKSVGEWLKKEEKTESITVDLMELLEGRGFPKATIKEAMRTWGNHAAEILRRNPYAIMKLPRCGGFKRADAMYTALGKDPNALKRQSLAAWHAVAGDSNGNTWSPIGVGLRGIRGNVGSTNLQEGKALVLAKRAGLLATQRTEGLNGPLNPSPLVGTSIWIAEAVKANQEERLARMVAMKAIRKPKWPSLDKLRDFGVSEHQAAAALTATSSEIGVLTGGPGTGKTTLLAAMVAIFCEEFGSENIGVCAPTNKAANRATQALHDKGVRVQASSIHRMLGVTKSGGGEWAFAHNASNPLPFRVLIIDEGSMIDTPLMASLFAAIAPGTLVLLMGDINQLPPIGHGAPMRDIMRCGVVPVGLLTETHRSAGRVVEACRLMAEGKPFIESKTLDPHAAYPENFKIIEAKSGREQRDRLMKVINRAKQMDFDPIWDVQPLVALNNKGDVSRKDINLLLQRELNSDGFTVPGNPFREGDKVVCRSNDFFPLVGGVGSEEADDENKAFVANGEFGRVTGVMKYSIAAFFSAPDREVVLPIGFQDSDAESDSGDGGGGGEQSKEKSSKRPVELGYAATAHFFQGSEVSIGVPLLDTCTSAKRVCTREWLTVGISRGKFLSVPIGMRATALEMIKRTTLDKRKTFLAELIRQFAGYPTKGRG